MGMDALLTETVTQGRGKHKLRFDEERGIIHNVKVLGNRSRNGRVYEAKALQSCARLYEGVPVHFGHLTDDYRDRCGTLHNCKVRGSGVYGDWHLNKGNAFYEQVWYDAKTNPQVLQMSHEVDRDNAVVMEEDGIEHIQDVTKVNSVAIVTEGATNSSLFEAKEMTLDELIQKYPKLMESHATASKADLLEQSTALQASVEDLQKQLDEAKTSLEAVTAERDTLAEEKAIAERKQAVVDMATELNAGELSESLIETYVQLSDAALKTILEDRAAAVKKATKEPESARGGTEEDRVTRETFPTLFRRN